MNLIKKIIVLAFITSTLSVFGTNSFKQEYRELKAVTHKKLEVVDKKLEKMGDKIAEMSGTAKEKMKDQYKNLVEMKNTLKIKLANAGEVTEDNWDKFKDNVEDYADKLENRVDKAIN